MRSCLLSGVALSVLIPCGPADAQVSAELEDLRVIRHHFSTTVGGSRRRLSVRDASAARYLVLLMEATFPSVEGRLYTYDFVLRYRRDDHEDRSGCRAIGPARGGDSPSIGNLRVGYGSFIAVDAETRHFGLACFIEDDVDEIQIFKLGSPEPLSYAIGEDRPYSVFLTTNRADSTLQRAAEAIRGGGFQVHMSRGLNAEQEGVTIHYRDAAEPHAREVSQRLIAALDVLPTVKEMRLVSEYDVVVWLGK